MPQPLDLSRVERIHARLLVRYGARWTGMWAGVEPDLVRADWSTELAGVSDDAIRHALGHLPAEFPPTASQFRALCIAHRPAVVALPAPKPDPTVARAALGAVKRVADHDPKAWAWRLKAREEQGERLSPVQRRFWREALRAEMASAQEAA